MAAAAVAPWPLGLDRADLRRCRAAILSLGFVVLAARVLANRATEPAGDGARKEAVRFSIIYLFALFGALVVDRWLAW